MNIPSDLYRSILESMPILCVDTLIIHDDKCLLLLRDNAPAKGTFWFPGGRVHKNELIKDAAVRKAKEETNLHCVFNRIVSIEETLFERNGDMFTDVHTVNVCCLMNVSDISMLMPDHLHTQYKWINKLDISYHEAVNNPLALIGFSF